MGRPRGNGVKVVKRKQADGTVREYHYLRRSAQPEGPPAGTIASLIAEYLGSQEYAKLASGTREHYRRHCEHIREAWGAIPIASIRPSDIQRAKDALAHQPGRANMLMCVLSVLFKFGMRRDLCVSNPAASPGKLPAPKRDQIWSRDDEQRVIAVFPPDLKLAFYLLLYTTQRVGDVLSLRRDCVSERNGRLFIALRQQKTGTLIDVPVHSDLAPLLRERLGDPLRGPLLVPSVTGKQWSQRDFARAWDHCLRVANLRLAKELFRQGWTKDQVRQELENRHRQRRDLRRTGVVRLAEAGATTAQIAAITGHKIDTCQRIIDTYLPRRTEVAVGGIEQWERGELKNIVRLHPKR